MHRLARRRLRRLPLGRTPTRVSAGRRARAPHLVAALVLLGAAVGGCAHFTPYYRGDQAKALPVAPGADVEQRIFLIGDTGDPRPGGEPTLELLARQVRQMPDRSTVVFLGDNVYERGMPKRPVTPAEKAADAAADVADAVIPDVFASRQEAERQLAAQVDVVRGTSAHAIFIAGNHDWDQFEPSGGWERVLALEEALREAAAGGAPVVLVPPGGCPGPTAVPIGDVATVIALDSQWWLESRPKGKPTTQHNPTDCPLPTETGVRDRLVADLEAAAHAGRTAIVAAHHPLDTEGAHGGFADIRTHLFPLYVIRHFLPLYLEYIPIPVVGSLVVGIRQLRSPSVQDISNGQNRHMRRVLVDAMATAGDGAAAPLLYAAGHDHSLQVFESTRGPRYSVVSGMGSMSRASEVSHNRRTLFAHSSPFHPGFMRVDFFRGGGVLLSVVEYDPDEPEGALVFATWLKPPPGMPAAAKP